jgi:hypothetical protein
VLKSEPVALISALAVVIVSALAAVHVGLETSVVETLIADVVIVAGAIASRSKVVPVANTIRQGKHRA